jgi:hypothetical protein
MLLMKRCAAQFPALVLIALGVSIANAQKAPIEITADLSDAPRKLFHAEIDFPVSAGPLTLISPEWIPGITCLQVRQMRSRASCSRRTASRWSGDATM